MTPELQTYASQDTGYQQFCNQYNLIASDPATQKEYEQWFLLQMKIWGENHTAREEGREEGRAEGRAERLTEVALHLRNLKTMSDEEIANLTGLTLSEVEGL